MHVKLNFIPRDYFLEGLCEVADFVSIILQHADGPILRWPTGMQVSPQISQKEFIEEEEEEESMTY